MGGAGTGLRSDSNARIDWTVCSRFTAWPACLLLIAALLGACSGDPGTGAVDVKWDRDVCVRCNMVLSARNHSAQVRYTPAGQRSKVHLFDDIGCAVLWLDKQAWKADPAVEIWVTDHRDGRWIDARSARYVPGQLTPMEYGLGAQTEADGDSLSFEQARQHIARIEERFNVHGAHLEQAAKLRQLAPIDSKQEQQR